MKSSLLHSKFYSPPPRPNLIARPHLLHQLDEAIPEGHKLTLISAPAGFGKTTILTTWHHKSGVPTAWLSLDEEDNDPARFLVYLVTALQAVAPEVGQTSLALLHTTQAISLKTVLTSLINDLTIIPHDFSLCLDDYHLIDSEEIHNALIDLVERSTERFHLALASRSDPPFPLSRWRVRGQLLELRQEELRFTSQEASAFFNQSFGANLTEAQVATLDARTEGWVAGLQLAGLSLRGKEDITTFIQEFSGSHRFVIDYLAEEVVSQQPDGLRQFMRMISILNRFSAPLCDAITGHSDSALLLKRLEDDNLFIIPLDDRREWYRFHHLFNDYLNAELNLDHQASLHQKAANWFFANALFPEAVKHALASGDTDLAVKVILPAAAEAFNQAAFLPLLGWLDALPEEAVRGNTALATYKGLALFINRTYEEALPYAQAAEKSLSPNTSSPIQGQFMSFKAHLALAENQLDQCVQFSRDALEYLDEEDHFFRNLTLNILGQVLEIKGDIGSAAEVYHQAFKTGWQAGDQIGALIVFTNLVFALNELGKRREAVALCERLSARKEAQTSHGFSLLDAVQLSWSLLSYEANALEMARERIHRALNILSAANFSQGLLWGWFILARIQLAEGDLDAMQNSTQKGIQLSAQLGRESLQGTWFKALEAQASLQQRDLTWAARWAEAAGISPHDTPPFWIEQVYLTYVRLLIAQKQYQEAQSLLSTIEQSARKGGRLRKVISVILQQALVQQSFGDTKKALSLLGEAIQIAAPQDYRRAFLDEGPAVASLLQKLPLRSHNTIEAEFVDNVLAAFGVEPTITSQQGLIESLSERELQVLRLLAAGFSSTEVARELYIAVGTARTHIKNIYRKLDVHSRSEALRSAHESGLLKNSSPYG